MAEKEKKSAAKAPKAEKKAPEAIEAKTETVVKAAATAPAAAAAEAEPKVVKVKKSKSKRTVTEGRAYVQSSFNNTIITITDLSGNIIAWSSAGSNGFKGAKKATPYAAQISAEAAINKALLYGIEKLHVFVKGIGSGREQAVRGLHANNAINIESITDVTPVPHNGCRSRKSRRV